jgi:tRNA-specific 2-thiouridylase
VTEIRPESNTVVVGHADALLVRSCVVDQVSWIVAPEPPEQLRAKAKVRYRAAEVPCIAERCDEGLRITFDEPQRAITPGQALVLYDGEYVLGGGTITR